MLARWTLILAYVTLDKLDKDEEIGIFTSPKLFLNFEGFNVTPGKDCVTFSSAPGTGASVSADKLSIGPEYNKLYVKLSVDGFVDGKQLERFTLQAVLQTACIAP